jgi:transaldolase
MKIYVDSANLNDIRQAQALGLCDGVTTNPTLIAKEQQALPQLIAEICAMVEGPVHAEVLSLDYESILKEGRELARIAPNVVVKIPMLHDGLKAVKTFTDEGIKTNVTLIFTASQAILAAKAGASNVCPFMGRLDDISQPGIDTIAQITEVFSRYPDLSTEVLVASIRNPLHVIESALCGADILTIPSAVLTQMEHHPLTDLGIQRFLEDAKKFQ